jgi:uncharacterized protein YkwD/LysM repeat protein
MRKSLSAILVSVLLFGVCAPLTRQVQASPLPAPHTSASELIQLVNQLRAANGLTPYRVNNALMAAAQAHSEYQAATGTTSHTGKGGSRPRDRAVAYGYGGGAAVYVSENIATGTNLSAGEAVGWWQGDNIHLTTMLSSKYRDVGAGVAEANGMLYYTLVVGYIAGEEGQPPASQPSQDNRQPAGTPGANLAPAGTPVAFIVPVKAATPRSDGSIVHEVQYGQALYSIADAYQVELPYPLTINSLKADTVIYPGDKLWIRLPRPTTTPQISPTVQLSATITPANGLLSIQAKQGATSVDQAPAITPTRRTSLATEPPLALAEVPAQQPELAQPVLEREASADPSAGDGFDPVLVFIGVLIVVGTGLLLFGSLVGHRL